MALAGAFVGITRRVVSLRDASLHETRQTHRLSTWDAAIFCGYETRIDHDLLYRTTEAEEAIEISDEEELTIWKVWVGPALYGQEGATPAIVQMSLDVDRALNKHDPEAWNALIAVCEAHTQSEADE